MPSEPAVCPSPAPPRGSTGAQADAGGSNDTRDAQASERRPEGRSADLPPCGHAAPASRTYCPDCRAWTYDRRYATRHAGHTIVETDAIRRDGRPYRQCITCAPWRTPSTNPHRAVKPDPVAIDRAICGDPPAYLHRAERRAAIRALAGRLPAPVIAARVGCSERTVWRHLAAAA
jgi:hypothetical protein